MYNIQSHLSYIFFGQNTTSIFFQFFFYSLILRAGLGLALVTIVRFSDGILVVFFDMDVQMLLVLGIFMLIRYTSLWCSIANLFLFSFILESMYCISCIFLQYCWFCWLVWFGLIDIQIRRQCQNNVPIFLYIVVHYWTPLRQFAIVCIMERVQQVGIKYCSIFFCS